MKKLSIILSIWFSCTTLVAQTQAITKADSIERVSMEVVQKSGAIHTTKVEGDHAYAQNDFRGAIAIYEQIIHEQGISADIYYNLGNSYYKVDEVAKAVLNYERALLLDPSDRDILFNLELARAKTIDKVAPQPEIFLATWYSAITNLLSETAWAKLGILFFICAICSLAFYLFAKSMFIRKIAFIKACAFTLFCLCVNLFASQQKNELITKNQAIIMQPTVTVKSTPNSGGTDLFILHEGRKVTIKDASMNAWKEIELEDGHVGWVPTEVLEII
ncbi:MAG: tetratricopeptide repeat protein [Phocaeicola sp.]